MKVLLVEDDYTIACGLEYSLQQEGYVVQKASTVAEAMESISGEIDLYLLDLSLPDGSGYDVCKKIKCISDVPVIFLTACDEEVNVVMGIDMGADDYITKPFRVRELMSRIKMVLRRYSRFKDIEFGGNANNQSGNIIISNLIIKTNEMKVYKDGKDVELTALEYRLLLMLVNNKGNVLSRNQLLSGIWDVAGDYVNDNTLTVYIKRLRDKLEKDPVNPTIIETVRGLGYRIG